MRNALGNILWLLLGGWAIAIEYFIASLGLMITVVGIPFGLQSMKLGVLALWPFGSRVATVDESSGCLNLVMNIIWIIIGGFWIALTHIALGCLLCITVIGIPFGLQHFKFVKLALFPFGKVVEDA